MVPIITHYLTFKGKHVAKIEIAFENKFKKI